MAIKQTVFSDRLVGLSIQNGLVRMDLATISGRGKNKEGQDAIKMDVTHQLVMPLDAFVASVGMQQNLVQELVKRRDALAAQTKQDAAPAAT